MPRIGDLRTRVEILRPSTTRDEQGGLKDESPLFQFAAWAEVIPKSMSEQFQAGKLESVVFFSVTLRERRDVRAGDLVRYQGTLGLKDLRVQAVLVKEERGVWTVLSCEEIPGVVGSCS